MAQTSRPVSPHLTVYRFQITMAMSIIHRITGVALYFGMILLAWFLVAAAWGDEALATFQGVAGSWFGQIILFLASWTLFHHMLSGIRYLIWDTGNAMTREARFGLSWAAAIGGFVLAVLVWIFLVWL